MAGVSLSDSQRLDAHPFTSGSVAYRLDVSVVDATLALPSGGYVLILEDATVAAICRLDAVASEPASGASLSAAFLVPAGSSATLYVETSATLHAVMRSGTGRLFLQRVI